MEDSKQRPWFPKCDSGECQAEKIEVLESRIRALRQALGVYADASNWYPVQITGNDTRLAMSRETCIAIAQVALSIDTHKAVEL